MSREVVVVDTNDFNPELHPRDDEGKFTETGGAISSAAQEAISQIDEIVERGSGSTDNFEERSELATVVEEQTGVSASFRGGIEESGKIAKEAIKLDEKGELDRLNEIAYSRTKVPSKNASGHYDKRARRVSINPEVVESGELQEWADQGHIGDGSTEWLVRHEVGHHNHIKNVRNDDNTDFKDIRQRSLSDDEVATIQEELSDYGASQQIEFIAEAYAAKQSGQSLSDELELLYQELGGPVVET